MSRSATRWPLGVAGLAIAACSVGPLGGAASGAAPPSASPTGQALIVTANLQEASPNSDLRDMREMRIFADRLLAQVPYVPDALFLQEVRHKSARYVAEVLTRRTGDTYAIAVDAGRDPWYQENGRVINQDTAIVANTDTMRVVGPGGYFLTPSGTSKFGTTKYKKQAYGELQERGSSFTLPGMSVHMKLDKDKMARWARRMADFMQNEFPSSAPGQMRTIAGDFNQLRYTRVAPGEIRIAPFWNVLTGDPYNYKDVIVAAGNGHGNGVDYMFVQGRVYDGGGDWDYPEGGPSDPSRYYSDHRFRWGVVGPAG